MPSVLIEPIKIQQVFQNLISNGIKFMDKPQEGGLSPVKKIVEGKGGKVTVVSPGEGIEFGFTLPKKGENSEP